MKEKYRLGEQRDGEGRDTLSTVQVNRGMGKEEICTLSTVQILKY